MRRALSAFLLTALALLAAPALSEPPQSSSSLTPEILIRGTRNRQKQIRMFVEQLTPAPVHGQLSRFEVPVCPFVGGLPADQAASIVVRMRQVATGAGIRVAKAGCDPNVILIVTSDKKGLLKRIEKYRPEYFPADWSTWAIHGLEHDASPVAAWQFQGTSWADGRPVMIDSLAAPADISAAQKTTEPQSRLQPSARPNLETAVIVLQRSALDGLTTSQIADYAVMRTFVRTDPRTVRRGTNTILTIIDAPMGSAVPLTMTRWDLSLLKAVYASSANSYAEYQRAEIEQLMQRDLSTTDATEP